MLFYFCKSNFDVKHDLASFKKGSCLYFKHFIYLFILKKIRLVHWYHAMSAVKATYLKGRKPGPTINIHEYINTYNHKKK